jgi:hypothetical protein
MTTINANDFLAKSPADALAKAASFGSDAVKFGNGNFNMWMLAVGAAPHWNDDAIGKALYTKYAQAQNANPLCTRPINITKGNTLANKAAQINAFANASRQFGAAKVFAFVNETIATLKAAGGFDAEKVKAYVAKSVTAKALLPQADIKADIAKAAKAAKVKAKANEDAKKAAPGYAEAVTETRKSLKTFAATLKGEHSEVFKLILKDFEARVTAKLKVVPPVKANGKGKSPVKAKTVEVAPRTPTAIN